MASSHASTCATRASAASEATTEIGFDQKFAVEKRIPCRHARLFFGGTQLFCSGSAPRWMIGTTGEGKKSRSGGDEQLSCGWERKQAGRHATE
jgi:hypothetical protein